MTTTAHEIARQVARELNGQNPLSQLPTILTLRFLCWQTIILSEVQRLPAHHRSKLHHDRIISAAQEARAVAKILEEEQG